MAAGEIEEIDVVHVSELSAKAQAWITQEVAKRLPSFIQNFKGFVEVRMVSSSPIRIESIEPIEGTDVDWFNRNTGSSEIDISAIF